MQFAPTLQTKLAAEAQAKYERELMLHAADVEALQELKKKVGLEGAQKRELEDKVNKTCSLLQEKTAAWSTLEKHLKVGQPARRCREQKTKCVHLHESVCSGTEQVFARAKISLGIGMFWITVFLRLTP